MGNKKLIGLDLGTGAVKGALWNSDGEVEATAERTISFSRPHEKWVEIDPIEYENLVYSILQELADASSKPIAAISMAAASGNTMLCDANGNPQTAIISWLDRRLNWCPPKEWNVRDVTGWPGIPSFPLMHLEYFRQNFPELLHRGVVAMNNDWLCWRLCGVHALDFSNATPFYLCNQSERRYEEKYLKYYGITEKQLPRLVPTGTKLGTLQARWVNGNLTKDTAIVSGSFDHPSAARGANITKVGELLLSCGTSWVVFLPYPDRASVPTTMLCDPFLSQNDASACWGGMFSLEGIGLKLEDFIVSHFGNDASRYDRFNDEALIEGSEANDFAMKLLYSFKAALDGTGTSPQQAIFCGGPSRGKAWAPLLEKVLGIPIHPSQYRTSTGAVGAAIIALQGIES